MRNFIHDNRKYLLAAVIIVLMITMLLPSQFKRAGDYARDVYGASRYGDVSQVEIKSADQQLTLLRTRIVRQISDPATGQPQLIPAIYTWGREPAELLLKHSETWALLIKEAEATGSAASDAEVNAVFDQGFGIYTNGRLYKLDDIEDDRERAGLSLTLRNFIKVIQNLNHTSTALKISKPALDVDLATQTQKLNARIAEYPALRYIGSLPEPTPEQLKAHYEKYANVRADLAVGDAGNGLGGPAFGYKYPDRVKLQYITVQRAAIREAVRASRDKNRWEVDAMKEYLAHQDRYTLPSTSPSTTPSSQPAAPTTRPFVEVRDSAMSAVMNPMIEQETSKIVAYLQERLASDYEEWKKQGKPLSTAASTIVPATTPTTEPSTVPASQPVITGQPPYASYEYLVGLAQAVQKQFGVLPSVVSLADSFRSAGQLSKEVAIGDSDLAALPFAEYAIGAPKALQSTTQPSQTALPPGTGALELYEPSKMLSDADGSHYVFRITDVRPSGSPESMEEVIGLVRADLRTQQAYDKALQQAKTVAEAAAKDGLNPAVSADSPVRTTGLFIPTNVMIEGLNITRTSRLAIQEAVVRLLVDAAAGKKPVVTVAPVPLESRVFVIELTSVQPQIPFEQRDMADMQMTLNRRQTEGRPLIALFFNPDAVATRTGFKKTR